MFALMMNEDTKRYTAELMQLELQKLGSSVSVTSDFDGTTFSVQLLKKNLEKTLVLLEERMLNPKFTEDAFSRIKKQSLESFKQIKSQPSAVADLVFEKINYGPGNILGMNSLGTETSVGNIQLTDVESFYSNAITSKRAKLVVVGDVSQNGILGAVGFLSKLPNKDVSIPSLKAAPPISK